VLNIRFVRAKWGRSAGLGVRTWLINTTAPKWQVNVLIHGRRDLATEVTVSACAAPGPLTGSGGR